MYFDKLMKLMGRLDEEGQERFHQAISAFFAENLASDTFSFCEGHPFDLRGFKEEVGEDVFQPVFMTAVEFFLSNEYPSEEGSWNAIDVLLKKRGALLPAQDKMYLKGLQQSYMSLFEVIDVKLDQSITVRNLLEEKEPPQIVKEKRGTHYLCPWDLLGARLVRTPQGTLFAGGLLLLERDRLNAAKEVIQRISKVMMSRQNLRLFQKDTKDPILMIKKMWAKEIAQNWFFQKTEEKVKPTFFNYDGDRLEFYTIEFPLKAPVREVVARIDNLSELIPHEIEGVPHAWFWPLEEGKGSNRKSQKAQGQKNGKDLFIDSQLSDEEGRFYRYKAELKIQGKVLRIDVNSEKRANDVEEFFKAHLGVLFGNPTRVKHDPSHASGGKDTLLEEDDVDLSPEEQTILIQQMLDQHYVEWLDSPLPYLKDKTPRQASKTQKGRQEVINLLKDMQNAEFRVVKRGIRTNPYNFDWIIAELGIEKGQLYAA